MNVQVGEAARAIQAILPIAPRVGIILGSGLSPVADQVRDPVHLAAQSIPHFPQPSVAGHAGGVIAGRLSQCPVIVVSGRIHMYEGYTASAVAFPVRVLHALGCHYLVVTNAAGALDPAFSVGDVMILDDHISFPSLAGHSPLLGVARSSSHSPFVDLTDAYDPRLRALASTVAQDRSILVRHGVYVMVGGPNYESPAEVRFLHQIGGSAVGMSSVPEVIVARQLGLQVLGLSVISNSAAATGGTPVSHEDVLRRVENAASAVANLIEGVLARLPC